ncbi:MAG TPA: universal stress protein [Dehalococcoidia bacterium]|nr:universal stress protein [Dehalococcoidia bacterium]
MFARVLVPLDESPHAERALSYAQSILNQHGGQLTLLTVVHTPPAANPSDPIARLQAERPERARQYLLERAEVLRGAGLNVETKVIEGGDTAEHIVELATTEQSEVIVMSTHGLGASGRYALGSVALKVLMTAPCPVFMARIQEAWDISPDGQITTEAEADVGRAETGEERWLAERLAEVDAEIARLDARAPALSDQVANASHASHEQAKWTTLWDLRQRALLLEERESILRARQALTA